MWVGVCGVWGGGGVWGGEYIEFIQIILLKNSYLQPKFFILDLYEQRIMHYSVNNAYYFMFSFNYENIV